MQFADQRLRTSVRNQLFYHLFLHRCWNYRSRHSASCKKKTHNKTSAGFWLRNCQYFSDQENCVCLSPRCVSSVFFLGKKKREKRRAIIFLVRRTTGVCVCFLEKNDAQKNMMHNDASIFLQTKEPDITLHKKDLFFCFFCIFTSTTSFSFVLLFWKRCTKKKKHFCKQKNHGGDMMHKKKSVFVFFFHDDF